MTTQKTDARGDERFPSALVAFASSWFVVALIAFIALTTVFDHREVIGYDLALLAASMVLFVAVVTVLTQRMFVYGRVDRRLTIAAWIAIPLGIVVVPMSEVWEMCAMSVAISSTLIRGRWVPAVVGGVFVIGTVVTVDVDRDAPIQAFAITLFTAATAGVLIALTELARALDALRASREEVARLLVDAERHRISRDLHDVIGRTLVTAQLRNQAAIQLFEHQPEKAREQLGHVHQVLDSGQADLRRITSGPILDDFESELSTVQAMCARLDIICATTVETPARCDVDRVFAAVVRESSTNMLKHAHPRRCTVRVSTEEGCDVIDFENDGVTSEESHAGTGTGIAALTRLVEDVGGTFTAGRTASGNKFRVVVTIPPAEADE
ncbi:MAG: histidine kinase [Rhodococcus sp. (in: high G+C Gram-positive bacteria)]|uniref:histidine kinase n=1 Tax=Rhodococcus sp. TaxID=1831 RepID=UPI002AD9BEA1|nr:histidine kinase [Rhodococcus sp. (in: high G+C Gram-positive bacteria)]